MSGRVGVIGVGRLGPTLAALLASGRVAGASLVAWSPVKEGGEPPAWLAGSGVDVVADWHDLMAAVDGVVVDLAPALHWHEREVLSEAAFEAGRALLVDAPLADFPLVYDRIQTVRRHRGARLWSVRPLRRGLALRGAVEEVEAGALGEVLAVHASLHLPVGGRGASFEQETNDIVDAALALAPAALSRVFAEGERGAGGAMETLDAVARLEGDAILSLEVGQVLPASLGEESDVVLEVTGREGFVRVEPGRAAVTVAGKGVARVPWREDTIAEAVAAWLGGSDEGEAEAAADRRLIAALRMIKRSRAKGEAVGPEAAQSKGA